MSQLLSLILIATVISGCSHPNVNQPKLKSVQVYKSNSGANYVFLSNGR